MPFVEIEIDIHIDSKFFVSHSILIFIDNEFGEKTVSILLDDEEASIIFIDHPFSEMSVSFNKNTIDSMTNNKIPKKKTHTQMRKTDEMNETVSSQSIGK